MLKYILKCKITLRKEYNLLFCVIKIKYLMNLAGKLRHTNMCMYLQSCKTKTYKYMHTFTYIISPTFNQLNIWFPHLLSTFLLYYYY